MAFLESAVVVYLRALYYPDGFDFPLAPMEQHIALTEVIREAATIIMLLGAGIIAGKNTSEKFAYFIYCFAIWDIFYYIYLKLLLGWPASFLTWDILFLIPIPWVGPVISPIILSFTMILFALCIIYFNKKTESKIILREWLLLILGSIILILSFTLDYSKFILEHFSVSELWSISLSKDLFDLSLQYIPQFFNWWLFGIGEIILLFAIVLFYKRNLIIISNI